MVLDGPVLEPRIRQDPPSFSLGAPCNHSKIEDNGQRNGVTLREWFGRTIGHLRVTGLVHLSGSSFTAVKSAVNAKRTTPLRWRRAPRGPEVEVDVVFQQRLKDPN